MQEEIMTSEGQEDALNEQRGKKVKIALDKT